MISYLFKNQIHLRMKKFFTFLCFMAFAIATFSQGIITGKLIDGETGEPLIGASVLLEGTSNGTVSDFDGKFTLHNVRPGSYNLIVSYIGYDDVSEGVVCTVDDLDVGTITCGSNAIGLSEVKVVASYAETRKTPVAVSNITAEEIELKVGNQEFPEILKSTPSIYATKSGGGFGDSRINVRGFNQRNVAVMINGIPVNDMENGWVYWSNWAGLSDVTKTTQIQRGLGASKLAINSVGGTINIITKTTDQKRGGTVFTNVGNNGYLKYGATVSTGRTENGWAFTVSGARTTGDGYIDATWVNAWSYFASVAKEIGDKHQLVFTAIGAPQRHGQRSFPGRLGTDYVPFEYDADPSTEIIDEYDPSTATTEETDAYNVAYEDFINDHKASDFMNNEGPGNITYNSDYGYLDGRIFNNRENFYHKPQLALNHYWDINSSSFLATSAYYSTGRGGGTGDRGSIGGDAIWRLPKDEKGLIPYDNIYKWNTGNDVDGFGAPGNISTDYGRLAGESNGIIRRASMNEHNWLGVLSTLNHDLSDNLKLLAGIDLRHYRGIHYRKVDNLLGTDAWIGNTRRNVNINDKTNNYVAVDLDGDGEISSREMGRLVLVDKGNFTIEDDNGKIHYDNDGIVGWQGGFAQLEYSNDKFTVFGAGSVSNTSYKREDRFNYTPDDENRISETFNFLGYNAKAGMNVNISDHLNVFVNGGYYSKAPLFDAVFYNFNNVDVNPDAINETIIAGEGGVGYRTGKVDIALNGYYTNWLDRTLVESYFDQTLMMEQTANIEGIDALHTGVELELAVYPAKGLKLKGMASIGSWEWKNDVQAAIFDDNNDFVDSVKVYADGLKVGDAAQTTLYGMIGYDFDFGLGLDIEVFHYDNLYADFDPIDKTDANATEDEAQALKLPAYQLLNAGLTYRFKISNSDARFRINVNNLLDKLYVAEASDRSELARASGYFGFGRTWNCGLKLSF